MMNWGVNSPDAVSCVSFGSPTAFNTGLMAAILFYSPFVFSARHTGRACGEANKIKKRSHSEKDCGSIKTATYQ